MSAAEEIIAKTTAERRTGVCAWMLSWFRNVQAVAVYRWHFGTFRDPFYPVSVVAGNRQKRCGQENVGRTG